MSLVTIEKKIAEFSMNTPSKIAIEFGKSSVTYDVLNKKSNKIANFLIEHYSGSKNVLLFMDKSIELIESLVGVIKSGGVFVPMDCNWPDNRIVSLLEEINLEWIITSSDLLKKVNIIIEKLEIEAKILVVNNHQTELIDMRNKDIFIINNYEEIDGKCYEYCNNKNCYIYFTSGSTGKPKAILGRHKSLMHFINWEINEFGVDKNCKVSLITPVSFDPFLRDVFVALCSGGTLCIPESKEIILNTNQLMKWIENNEITIMHMVPTLFKLLSNEIKTNSQFKKLKYIFLAGELLRGNDIRRFEEIMGSKVQLVNLYGPTETTLAKCFYRIKGSDVSKSIVPVGNPINGAEVYILDKYLEKCAIGVIGDIYIRTPYISSGYCNDKELTKKVFIRNPFSENPNDIIYRTGDLGRILDNGNIEVVGRADNQIKIRGMRIDTSEIENRLLQNELVKEAIVLAKDYDSDNKYLCGYVVFKDKSKVVNLKEYLSMYLPEHMIPSYFMQMNSMPINANGKIDRKKLLSIDIKIESDVEYVAPRNNVDSKLVSIFSDILNVEKIGIYDNFFDMGGHSLKASKLVAKVHEAFNVNLPISEVFNKPTVRELSNYIKTIENQEFKNIDVVDMSEYYEISSAQQRIYMLQEFDRESIAYNIPKALIIEGKLEIEKLKRAVEMLIIRHESLRTSFQNKDGTIVQHVYDYKDINFEIETIEVNNTLGIDEKINEFIRKFDLSKAPLFRVGLAKLQEERHLLLVDMHHIISDGTSIGIMIKEFGELYEGKRLDDLKIQYKDYSAWQNKMQQDNKLKCQEEYWVKRFGGEIPVLNLPTDYQRPLSKDFNGDSVSFSLGKKETEKLKEIARDTGSTMYMVLLSNFKILLSKYSGQEDIIVGSPIAGRHHRDLENIIGMFVNTLAIRSKVNGNLTYKEYLNELKAITLDAYENQEYQFEDIVDKVTTERDTSRNPLFDVMFVMQNMDIGEIKVNELRFNSFDWKRSTEKFDITMMTMEVDEKIYVDISFATSLYKKETMERMKQHYLKIIEEVIKNQSVRIKDIEIINDDEKRRILMEFNNTVVSFPENKTIQELFEEQVERTPDNIAVEYGNEQITYRELNERANAVAGVLRERGVGPDSIVGVLLDRSIEMIIGIMGILKAGGAYLPIDSLYPPERISYIIKDSGTKIIVTEESLKGIINSQCDILDLSDNNIYTTNYKNPDRIANANNLVYVIYTSGTTGNPKGAMIEHRAIINRLNWMQKKYQLNEQDVILQKTTYTFDVSVWEIFWWSLVGASVKMLPKGEEKDPQKIVQAIKEGNVTTIHFVPSMLSVFMEYVIKEKKYEYIKSLIRLFSSGEALKKDQSSLFNEKIRSVNGTIIVNLYGPTEAAVDVTYYDCDFKDEMQVVPIGKPIDNISIYILNSNNKLVPIGVPGEMYISGVGLARGYLNNEKLTGERFIDNPYKSGAKMYKTGDLARWLPDGNIEFLGRIDHQVKIRGFRIELGEIENILNNIQGIKEAAVIDLNDNGNKYLCAYYTSDIKYKVSELRAMVKNTLPDYMVPSYFIKLDEMPLNQSGKLNRKELPKPEGNIDTGEKYEEPRNELEKKLIEVWRDVLGVEVIGINDDFFSLGGDSIKAIQLISRAKSEGYKFEVKDLFKNPKIKDLSNWVEIFDQNIDQGIIEGDVPLTPIQNWFFEMNFKNRQHFNQCVMLYGRDGFEEEIITKVFDEIVKHHDALRMIYKKTANGIKQVNRGVNDKQYDLEVYDYIGEKTVKDVEITNICSEIQASINLENGPLIKIGLFKTNQGDHLLIAAHHLIIDSVSWRIIFEDFNEGYRMVKMGKQIIFPKKTTAFKEWSEKLLEYAAGYKIKNEVEFWNKVESYDIDKLPRDKNVGTKINKNTKTQSILLTERETEDLLKRVNPAYNTEINDILLTSVALAIKEWTKSKNVLINLESHGREEILKNTNISRTIGWFTSQYPVIIGIEDEEDISSTIKNVKDNLRRIPNKGIGYGILKYLSNDEIKNNINFRLMPEICFNYLGQFDQDITSEIFEISNIYHGETVCLDGESIYALDIKGMIREKRMTISISYNAEEYEDKTISLLLENYRKNICNLIDHCINKETKEVTVADITNLDIDSQEIDDFLEQLVL